MVLILPDLRVLDLETTQQRNLPGWGGGDCRKSSVEQNLKIQGTGPRKIFFPSKMMNYASRKTKFASVKSLRSSELFLGILLSEFRFTVFFEVES